MLVGFPLGHMLVTRVGVETFRRVCMSFDAYLVSFGLSRTLTNVGVAPEAAYVVLLIAALIDTRLLWSYFRPRPPPELATRGRVMSAPPRDKDRAALELIRSALAGLKFGELVIAIHEGEVVQISRTEKFRPPRTD